MMDQEAEQRRSAQRRLVDAIEGSHEGMLLVGADGQIVIANTQIKRFLPLAGDYLAPGARFDEAMARAVPSGMASTADGAIEEPGKILSTEGEVQLGGELWLKVSRGSTQDGGFFLFWSDISAIKERELRLREAKSEAEAASRSKSSFLANMSHELRTPLNAIIGFSEIMASEIFGKIGDPHYREYATLITSSGRHLLDIISSILDFAKCEAGQTRLRCEEVDLREVAEACVSMVEQQCASERHHPGLGGSAGADLDHGRSAETEADVAQSVVERDEIYPRRRRGAAWSSPLTREDVRCCRFATPVSG